jgi:hypothetical protein
LFAHEFGARHANAVLAGEGTFELKDERGNLVGELAKFLNVLFGAQIEDGSNVKQPGGGVAVLRSFETERRHD